MCGRKRRYLQYSYRSISLIWTSQSGWKGYHGSSKAPDQPQMTTTKRLARPNSSTDRMENILALLYRGRHSPCFGILLRAYESGRNLNDATLHRCDEVRMVTDVTRHALLWVRCCKKSVFFFQKGVPNKKQAQQDQRNKMKQNETKRDETRRVMVSGPISPRWNWSVLLELKMLRNIDVHAGTLALEFVRVSRAPVELVEGTDGRFHLFYA